MPTVLITGASTGIGRATALRLAGSGWTVLAGVRKAADGEALKADGGERIVPIELDVTDAAQIAAAVAEVDGRGRLDALVNNAGIGFGGPLELVPIDDLRNQFEVNVLGPVALTQALLPALRRARGRILFISSVGGRVAMAFTAPYAASKHAIEAIGGRPARGAAQLARAGGADRAGIGRDADLGQESRAGRGPAGPRGAGRSVRPRARRR